MLKQPYILVAGETIVDNKMVPGKTNVFESHSGGSCFNVSIGLGRLKSPVAYLATLSTDFNGEIFYQTLKKNKVAMELIERSTSPSALAWIFQNKNKLEYQFYVEGTSILVVNKKKIPLKKVKLFHFGSFTAVLNPKADYYYEIAKCLSPHCLISYDINSRPKITPNKKEVLEKMRRNLAVADIIKLSDEDLALTFGGTIDSFVKKNLKKNKMILYTLGEKGATIYFGEHKINISGLKVKVKDTIGAGDCLMACFLHLLTKNGFHHREALNKLTKDHLKEIAFIINQASALNCMKRGAQPPTREELLKSLAKPPSLIKV